MCQSIHEQRVIDICEARSRALSGWRHFESSGFPPKNRSERQRKK